MFHVDLHVVRYLPDDESCVSLRITAPLELAYHHTELPDQGVKHGPALNCG